MASFYELTVGQQIEFQRVLADAGLTAEMVKGFIRRPDLAAGMFNTLPRTTPSWYRTPERQIQRAHLLWPSQRIPSPPTHFIPRSQTEILLLHVPRSCSELWDIVRAPFGCRKLKLPSVNLDDEHMRLAPNIPNRHAPVWLGFDYATHQGVPPSTLWGRSDLAAGEVLSALIQFPDWMDDWNGKDVPYPALSGYQVRPDPTLLASSSPSKAAYLSRGESGLDHYLYIVRSNATGTFELCCCPAALGESIYASPVVREC